MPIFFIDNQKADLNSVGIFIRNL